MTGIVPHLQGTKELFERMLGQTDDDPDRPVISIVRRPPIKKSVIRRIFTKSRWRARR